MRETSRTDARAANCRVGGSFNQCSESKANECQSVFDQCLQQYDLNRQTRTASSARNTQWCCGSLLFSAGLATWTFQPSVSAVWSLGTNTLASVMEQFRPPHEVQRDTELALAFRDGDEDAVRTLYERFGGLVFTVAHRILGDGQRAEDVTQPVFLQAWRHADHFDAGRDFAPWLATIARRAAIDALRKEQRRLAEALDHADPSDSALVTLPPSAEQIETVWSVRTAIDSLDPNEREVIRLQHLQGHMHSEIAEQLGVAVGTVKSRSHRAHRRLATRLGHLRQDVDQ